MRPLSACPPGTSFEEAMHVAVVSKRLHVASLANLQALITSVCQAT